MLHGAPGTGKLSKVSVRIHYRTTSLTVGEIMLTKRQALHIATTAGEILLQSGAEIFRVHETINRILDAFEVQSHANYVLSNGIFVTLDEQQEDNCVSMRFVPAAAIHLGRIAAVNELSREIEQNPGALGYEGYLARLEQCASAPHFPLWLRVLGSAVGSAGFCFLLGGSAADSIGAFVCGLLLQLFLSLYGKNKLSRFMPTILGAALVSTLAVLMTLLPLRLSLDHVIIGAIMTLVPGVALTTSIRDFFSGDFLCGTIHLIDALLTGVCIAVGVGAALQIWQLLLGVGVAL